MKKVFKISLGIVLTFIVITSSAFASPIAYTNEFGGIKTTPVSVTSADGNTTVSISAIKPTGDAENVTFIMTVYNKVTKKLESAKMLTQSVGNTSVPFTFADITGITENHEINTSLVSLTDKFMPMGIPMTKPAKADAVNLRDLKIDGVSIIDKFDDENKLTYTLTKKLTDTGAGVVYTYDELTAKLMPYTVDAGSTVDITNGDTSSYKQTLTVTDTSGNTKDYIINYVYPIHAVTGASEDTDFEEKDSSRYPGTSGSTSAVASTALGGDGILYTNLHAGVVNGSEVVDAGSVPFANYVTSTSSSYWLITAMNDMDAVGADYFGLNTNTGGTFGENAKYDGTNLFNTLEDGTEWLKFNLTRSARVTLYTTVDAIDAYEADGWTGESNTETPYIICNRADKLAASTHIANYTYKVYKDFPAGEVVIRYHTALNDNARAPFITVKH